MSAEGVKRAERLKACLKFRFGSEIKDLFNAEKYEIEETPEGIVYIYSKGGD